MVLGDARRQLVRLPDGHFDVIILDGFCSDAIPVHLLTREAFQLYFQKLAPGGVLAVHISNNHLDLPPLVARIARREFDPPLSVRYSHDMASEAERADGKSDSQWMVLARSDADLGKMATNAVLGEGPGRGRAHLARRLRQPAEGVEESGRALGLRTLRIHRHIERSHFLVDRRRCRRRPAGAGGSRRRRGSNRRS